MASPDRSAAQRYRLSRRPWVRYGSPLWALLSLLDGIDWLALQTARFIEGTTNRASTYRYERSSP